jgi:hypothetical protein
MVAAPRVQVSLQAGGLTEIRRGPIPGTPLAPSRGETAEGNPQAAEADKLGCVKAFQIAHQQRAEADHAALYLEVVNRWIAW